MTAHIVGLVVAALLLAGATAALAALRRRAREALLPAEWRPHADALLPLARLRNSIDALAWPGAAGLMLLWARSGLPILVGALLLSVLYAVAYTVIDAGGRLGAAKRLEREHGLAPVGAGALLGRAWALQAARRLGFIATACFCGAIAAAALGLD